MMIDWKRPPFQYDVRISVTQGDFDDDTHHLMFEWIWMIEPDIKDLMTRIFIACCDGTLNAANGNKGWWCWFFW